MNDYISWGQEYLDEAERIKRRLLVIRAERDYDIAGEQASVCRCFTPCIWSAL